MAVVKLAVAPPAFAFTKNACPIGIYVAADAWLMMD